MAIFESALIDKQFTDSPRTHVNPGEYGGEQHVLYSFVTFTTDHDDGDQVIVMKVPSNFVANELAILSDGGNTAGTLDIGVYSHNEKEGGSWTLTEPVSGNQDFFASAQAIATAISAWTDITGESGDCTIAKRGQPLWQALGLSEDPGGYFLLVAEVETADIDASVVVGFRLTGVR